MVYRAGLSRRRSWVQIPSPSPYANVAQQVEHFHGKEGVTGSNPVIGSMGI